MKSAKAFLLKFDPSLKNENVEKMNNFSGEFLLYMMSEYAKGKSELLEELTLLLGYVEDVGNSEGTWPENEQMRDCKRAIKKATS